MALGLHAGRGADRGTVRNGRAHRARVHHLTRQ
jgi:hypothetical protein